MADEKKSKRAELSEDDHQSAMRLYAEATKAIEGLAKIAAKALDVNLGDEHRRTFAPRLSKPKGVEGEVLEFQGIEIIWIDKWSSVCIDHDSKVVWICYRPD
jgi:hypothetical protein